MTQNNLCGHLILHERADTMSVFLCFIDWGPLKFYPVFHLVFLDSAILSISCLSGDLDYYEC